MSKKKRKEKTRPQEKKLSAKQGDRLYDAVSLLRRGRWAEARAELARLDRDHPDVPDVLLARLEYAQAVNDLNLCEDVATRLLPLRPRDAELVLFTANAHALNTHPALALKMFHTFLERWPGHPEAEKVRTTVASLEPVFREQAAGVGLGEGPEAAERSALHEEIQIWLHRGKYARCVELCDRLLQALPGFVPALNNSAQALWLLNKPEQAIERCRRALVLHPENVHALANLSRYLLLSGHVAEAEETARPLNSVPVPNEDSRFKIAETFSFLGDDEAVLRTCDTLLAGRLDPHTRGMVEHLAAVARYRRGDEEGARRAWEEALREAPNLEMARKNLADLDRPVGERHAAWAYPVEYWLSRSLVEEWLRRARAGGRRKRAGHDQEVSRQFLRDYPQAGALVPVLLDRGDEASRVWALNLARMARTPEQLQALRDFALSNRGRDGMRMEAGTTVLDAGLLPSNRVRMWTRGQWSEVRLLSFEITPEHRTIHSPEVEEMAGRAHALLQEDKPKEAEQLLRQALEREPDSPSLKNNLAAALAMMRRDKEFRALVREIHEQHPDYFFGRANLARQEIRAGRVEEGKALLDPLLDQRQLHTSEFRALAAAEVELGLALKQPETVRYWLETWEKVLGDEPQLQDMRDQVERATARDVLGEMMLHPELLEDFGNRPSALGEPWRERGAE